MRGCPKTGALRHFVTGSCEPTTTVSGLSSRPDCSEPAITRPVRQFHYSLIFVPLVINTRMDTVVSCPCGTRREFISDSRHRPIVTGNSREVRTRRLSMRPTDRPLRGLQRRAGSLVSRQSGCVARLAWRGLQVCDPQRRAPFAKAEAPKAPPKDMSRSLTRSR